MTAPARTRHPAGRFDRQIALVASLTLVVIGGLVLLGEALGTRWMTAWAGDVPAAAPITGLSIVLIGTALLSARPTPPLRWISLGISSATAILLVTTLWARAIDAVHPVARWLAKDPDRPIPLPSYTTVIALAALTASAALIALRRPIAAQVLMFIPLVVGGVAALGFVYGDRSSIRPGSAFPGTRTSIPSAAAMIIGAVAVLASTSEVGMTAWFWADSPGRRTVRRILPLVIGVILLAAGISRWTELEDRTGAARSLAIVVVIICSAICVLAVLAARTIDDLSADANRAQLLELDLANAKRAVSIAELATALSAAGSVEEVARVVSEGSTGPVHASVASVGMLDVRTGLVQVHHGTDVDDRMAQRYSSVPIEADLALTEAIRTGLAVLIDDYDAYCERYPETDASNAALGRGARASMPLRSQHGVAFGSLILAWDGPVELNAADSTAAPTLSTMADLVAQALERARLGEERLIEAERIVAISEFAQRLADSVSAAEISETTAATARGLFGATYANLGLLDATHSTVGVSQRGSLRPSLERWLSSQDLDDRTPLNDAALHRRPVLLPDVEAITAAYPQMAATMTHAGLAACAAVPVLSSDNQVLGALGVAWSAPIVFDDRTLGMLTTVAELVGQTLERTRLSEAEHRLAMDLQTRVLRPFPVVSGLSIAGRYRPADAAVLMGGDWYEGVAIEPHRTAIVVGDVVGHGVAATADMAQLRSVISALLRVGVPLSELFVAVGESIDERSNVMATAFVGIIDTETHELTYVSAGHPPALLAREGGPIELLMGGRGPLIGVPARTLEPGVEPFDLDTSLVVYTDGLIERRDEGIDSGIERLRAAASSQLSPGGTEVDPDAPDPDAPDLEVLCDALISACSVPSGFPDDVALLVARATGQ